MPPYRPIEQFVAHKSKQLCFYLNAFWLADLPHQELQFYFWDTLEEWSLINASPVLPYSHKERVFWHIMYQIHFWPEYDLHHNICLCDELRSCLHFLADEAQIYPFDCIGVRPQ